VHVEYVREQIELVRGAAQLVGQDLMILHSSWCFIMIGRISRHYKLWLPCASTVDELPTLDPSPIFQRVIEPLVDSFDFMTFRVEFIVELEGPKLRHFKRSNRLVNNAQILMHTFSAQKADRVLGPFLAFALQVRLQSDERQERACSILPPLRVLL